MQNKILRLFSLLLLITVLLVSGCGDSNTVDLKYRRAAVLHGEGTSGAIDAIDEAEDDFPDINAAQAFVYDTELAKFVFLKGKEKILYPASVTKLLTILTALENMAPDELVTPGDELSLLDPQSSIAFIKTHHTLSVEMLIEAMLLPSGGDAAYALASASGRKLAGNGATAEEAVTAFIKEMNEYARKIGMCGSNFTSPDGFYDPENYSTLEDMALLSIKAYENELIMKYASLPSDDVVYASGHSNRWINTNLMLHEESEYHSPYVKGLKTGTLEGNSCLVSVIEIGEKTYIAGVFSEKEKTMRFEDMLKIVTYYEKENGK